MIGTNTKWIQIATNIIVCNDKIFEIISSVDLRPQLWLPWQLFAGVSEHWSHLNWIFQCRIFLKIVFLLTFLCCYANGCVSDTTSGSWTRLVSSVLVLFLSFKVNLKQTQLVSQPSSSFGQICFSLFSLWNKLKGIVHNYTTPHYYPKYEIWTIETNLVTNPFKGLFAHPWRR